MIRREGIASMARVGDQELHFVRLNPFNKSSIKE